MVKTDSHEMNQLTHRNHHHNNNNNNGNSICFPNNQMQLLTALLNHQMITFEKILNSSAIDINYCYDEPYYKTCLEIACCQHIKTDFIELLLKKGADPNLINTVHKKAALHFTIDPQPKNKHPPNIEVLKLLLKQPKIDVNILSKGRTPLMYAIKLIEDNEINMDQYIEAIRLLLEAKADVNIPDSKDTPPIFIAAEKNYHKIVTLILDHSKINVDLDSYKDRHEKTARDLITAKKLYSRTLPKYNEKRLSERILFRLLNQRKEDEFKTQLKNFKQTSGDYILSTDNGLYTLLQLASIKGLEKSVQLLLNEGAEPNLTHGNNLNTPIQIAAEQGYHKILKIFLNHADIRIPDSILHTIVKNMNNEQNGDNHNSDYSMCLDILLDDPRINVNSLDFKNNTALHYAARNSDYDSTLRLLRAGACISIRNTFKQPPLADISAQTLHKYLDECLSTNDQRCTDENYEIRFNYKFLVPPNNVNCLSNQCSLPIEETDIASDTYLAPEIDALLYMSKTPELRKLLQHPVLTSFLFLKWQRISSLFYLNLIFYILFCVSLILYILIGYGQSDSNNQTVINILKLLLLIGVIILTMRELFQFLVSTRVYLKNFENWLELPLIFITFLIAFHEPNQSVRQQLSAIAILLSAAELVLLIGQHPKLSTNIVMLRTVSWNFFKFLLWYSILIIAFSLSFYTLFREDNNDSDINKNVTKENTNDEENFFLDPGMSLFKTIVMLTGEFDAASINFKTFPITSHLIFVMFVFLIAIVLFNLLNGLAVSDTQMIKNNAELVGYIARIKLISYFESMILGDLPPITKLLQKIFCCINITNSYFCLRPLAERICLFPKYLPAHRISIRPNQGRKIIHNYEKSIQDYTDYSSTNSCMCLYNWCNELKMDSHIIKTAKLVIADRSKVNEFDELKKMFSSLQNNLIQCEQQIIEKDRKIDEISQALLNITNILTNKTSDD